jgi:hypothetical protein
VVAHGDAYAVGAAKRRPSLVSVVATALLALAACSSSSSGQDQAVAATATPSSTSSTAANSSTATSTTVARDTSTGAGLEAQVIGIPTLAATDPQLGGTAAGIGFAVPSSTVKLIADQLVETGHVTRTGRAALGIVGANVMGSTGNPAGVLVRQVNPDQRRRALACVPAT